MKPTDAFEDFNQDRIFIEADQYEFIKLFFNDLESEEFKDRKAKVRLKEEEFAEYEIISSELH